MTAWPTRWAQEWLDDLQSFLVLGRDDLQGRVAIDGVAGVDQAAVDLAGEGRLGQACADGLGHPATETG